MKYKRIALLILVCGIMLGLPNLFYPTGRAIAQEITCRTLAEHKDGVLSIAFSPDGKILASGSYDKTIKLWRAANGEVIRTLKGQGGIVYSVAFSPDGKILASWPLVVMIKPSDSGGSIMGKSSGH